MNGIYCDGCGKFGYTDEFSSPSTGIYLCVRCSMPHLDWKAIDERRGE